LKKIFILNLLFVLVWASTIHAQLYFCANYTDAGDPVGVANTFSLSESGGYVYMLYSNKKKAIHQKTFNIVVTRQSGKDFVPYQTAVMEVQDKKTWAVADYHFTAPGTFKVSLQEPNGREVAKNFVSVFLKSSTTTDQQTIENDPEQSYYNLAISFCTSVEEGKPKGLGSAFTTGKLTVFLDNDKPFSTDSMVVMVYKKGAGSTTYDQYSDNKKYVISRTSSKTYFEWTFNEGGEYSVEVYNGKYAKMGTGYVTIQNSGTIDKTKDPDQSYYNATATFCLSVADGKPVNSGETFKAGEIYLYLINDKPLATDSIIVDVMKKAYESDKYNIYITTKDYGVEGKLKGTFFPLELDETGKYKISVYNRRMQRISEGMVTIR
jgi:hypothetical protein